MGKPDALAGLVLRHRRAGIGRTRARESCLGDAAAVVLDIQSRPGHSRSFWTRPRSRGGRCGRAILDGVVDQVAEDLLQRQAIGRDDRRRAGRLTVSPPASVSRCCTLAAMPSNRAAQIHGLGIERPLALAGELQDGVDQAVHLPRRGADERDRLGKIRRRRRRLPRRPRERRELPDRPSAAAAPRAMSAARW